MLMSLTFSYANYSHEIWWDINGQSSSSRFLD